MERTVEEIVGDTPGHVYTYSVYRFRGRGDGAPSAYLQAALHGGELPGTVALDRLMERLRQAEAEGRILGDITVVPTANPIARGQQLFGELQGRFHLGTRINFNRDFPLLERPDAALLPEPKLDATADQRLKRAAGRTVDGPRHRAGPALRRRGRALSLRAQGAVAGDGGLRRRHGRRGGGAVGRARRWRLRGSGDPSLPANAEGRGRPGAARRDHGRVARPARRRDGVRGRRCGGALPASGGAWRDRGRRPRAGAGVPRHGGADRAISR